MDLDAARDLKRRIRRGASTFGRAPFAIGITCRSAGDYRVAVLLSSETERHLLTRPLLREILQRERKSIDVEVVGPIRAATARRASESHPAGSLRIGISIGHERGGMGSLGFFAARRRDNRVGLVSCNHVIAMFDRGKDGDVVVSPAVVDGGARAVASLDGGYPRLTAPGGPVADCAFAALHDDVAYDAASVDGGTLTASIAAASPGLEVAKVGRITNASRGVVAKVEVDDVCLSLGMNRVVFHDVVVIASTSSARFCAHGDSGALVYTSSTFQPVGLLFATSLLGGPQNDGQTWMHPLRRVTEALDVDLVTDRSRRR